MNISKDDLIAAIKMFKKNNQANEITEVLNAIENFINNNSQSLADYENSKIRFCDYYSTYMHGNELVEFFDENYEGVDKEKNTNLFLIYCMFKSVIDLLELYELALAMDDEKNIGDYLKDTRSDINYLINALQNGLTKEQDNTIDLSFIDKNKYNIFFSGMIYKDIQKLPKHVMKAFIKKMRGELSKEDVLYNAEGVGHIRDRYDVPLLRIQLSDDYRVAFIRIKGTTIIVGAELKSGKDSNYTRYDSVAEKIGVVYAELDGYLKGQLSENSTHNKTLQYLKEFLEKNEVKDKNQKK